MVVYILQWKGIPTYDSVLTGINLLTYFKGKVTTMLVANSRDLRFIINHGSQDNDVSRQEEYKDDGDLGAGRGKREGVQDVSGDTSIWFEQKYFAGFSSSLQTYQEIA